MARVHFVKKAGKSKFRRVCRICGHVIVEGESYYHWANRIGTYSSKGQTCGQHRPRPSHLTTSDKLATLYAAVESAEDSLDEIGSEEDVQGILETLAEAAREVGEMYGESADNIEQSFQNNPTAEECREKQESLDSWADDLEGASFDDFETWLAANGDDETSDEDEGEDEEKEAVADDEHPRHEEWLDYLRDEAGNVMGNQPL